MSASDDNWPAWEWPDTPECITPPKPNELRCMRFIILCGLGLLFTFFAWLLQPQHRGDPWLDYMLLAGLSIYSINLLLEWRYYWTMKAPPQCQARRLYTVDMLTTACPCEPRGMILRTLEAMQKVTYPHTSYLCDEGDDPELKAACERLGVVHVTRIKKEHAKAGNINNALYTKCSGEIVIILDPDHEPAPFMIDRLLGYFDADSIGFVQSIQAYRNQSASQIAHEAAQMQYHFYGPIQMGMHGAGTPQAIGANCAFRRSALDTIGGHASGLAEDMHTSMHLYAKEWKGIYVPEVLTRGLVPQTLAAFYQQQLKWSCGVFDLFFQTYPKIIRSLKFSQKLHFLFCPVYFMQGWVTLICTLVPVLCLLFGGVAWRIRPEIVSMIVLPLVLLVLITRALAQRFVLNASERGLHIASGLLANGTWWVFSVGNLCALFRKHIPYVPTPKDDEPEDAWKLSVPNLIVSAACFAAIPYGLIRDLSIYTILMALFALWNALALLAVALQGQQKTNARLYAFLKRSSMIVSALHLARIMVIDSLRSIKDVFLFVCRTAPITATLTVLLAASGSVVTFINTREEGFAMPWMHLIQEQKDNGGFLTGYYTPFHLQELDALPRAIREAEATLEQPLSIASLYIAWGPQSLEHFPQAALEQIIQSGGIPMITWEPWASTFPWTHEQNLELSQDKGILRAIAAGNFDYYIKAYADRLRKLERPIFLRFGHEMDNPQYPWSPKGGDGPESFITAWRRVVSLFNQQGASNVGFVYNPWRGEAIDLYYPGDNYVDWIGITLLNYGLAGRDGKWHDFESLYSEFDRHLNNYNKPVMLAEFGTTGYGGNAAHWLSDALSQISSKHSQIKAAVLFHSDSDSNWATDWRPSEKAHGIDWSVLDSPEAVQALTKGYSKLEISQPQSSEAIKHEPSLSCRATQLKGASGTYSLEVNGTPFYIKGVAYNPGHDWRDQGDTLSRRKLEADFERIKAMGANTIRRYSGGMADYNLFNAAAKNDLKVLYGLWLKQDADYVNDHDLLKGYEEGFIRTVKHYRDEEALLGWVIGNEVWGMFKHAYQEPLLTNVRIAFVQFVEHIAQEIKKVDPDHPVFVACEHTEELAGAISDYVTFAPSVDVIGINTYYPAHLEALTSLVDQFGQGRPYILSEFGPDGYWHDTYSPRMANGLLEEPSATEKARMYFDRWQNFIQVNKGKNLGGVAYCWSARLEGSSTWFGIVSSEGYEKPAYQAIKEAYTNEQRTEAAVQITKFALSEGAKRSGQRVEVLLQLEHLSPSSYELKWDLYNNRYVHTDVEITESAPGSGVFTLRVPAQSGLYWLQARLVHQNKIIDEKSISFKIDAETQARPTVNAQTLN